MTKTDGKKKATRPSVKFSSYAPAAAFLGSLRAPAPATRPAVGRLQTKSLKCLTGGGFKVQTQASVSAINTARAQAKPTVLDHLRRWNGVALENGWDQQYIDSFIAKEIAPPVEEPDSGKRTREPGVSLDNDHAG